VDCLQPGFQFGGFLGLKQPGSPSDGEELQGGIQWMDFWMVFRSVDGWGITPPYEIRGFLDDILDGFGKS